MSLGHVNLLGPHLSASKCKTQLSILCIRILSPEQEALAEVQVQFSQHQCGQQMYHHHEGTYCLHPLWIPQSVFQPSVSADGHRRRPTCCKLWKIKQIT